jgi:Arc/MetJ family transcription regulator
MRTTLHLDDVTLAKAVELCPGKTKTEILNEALQEFVRKRRLPRFLDFEGKMRWEGNVNELRGRGPVG